MCSMQKFLTGLLASSLMVLGAGIGAGSAIAQTDADLFDTVGTDDDGAAVFGDSSNPFEMIHRAIQSPSMSGEEYRQYQNRILGDEASNFRTRQREIFQQQPVLTIEDAATDITVDGEEL